MLFALRQWAWRSPKVLLHGGLWCVLVFACPIGGLEAAEWSIKGEADLSGTYDDNIRLRSENQQSVGGIIFAPELDVRRRSEIWDLTFTTDLAIARYTEDSSLNRNDVRFLFDGAYRTRLGELGLTGEASRISTLITETTDSGNLNTNTDRDLIDLSPYWSYDVSARDTVDITGRWTQATFGTNALADYRNFALSGGWSRQVTRADVMSIRGFGSRFESDRFIKLTSDNFGFVLGWGHAFSERLQTSIAAGPSYFSTETPVIVGNSVGTTDDSSLSYRLDASIDYKASETTSLTGSFRRAIQPTSSGTPVQRNTLQGSVRHEFLPLLSAQVQGYFQFDGDPIDNVMGDRGRNFLRIEPQVTWDFAADWALSARYRFRTQGRDIQDRANSNSFFVTLTFRPLKETFGH